MIFARGYGDIEHLMGIWRFLRADDTKSYGLAACVLIEGIWEIQLLAMMMDSRRISVLSGFISV